MRRGGSAERKCADELQGQEGAVGIGALWGAAGCRGELHEGTVGALLLWTRKNLKRTFLNVLSISKAFLFLGY